MSSSTMQNGTYWNGERYVAPGDPGYDARMGEWIVRHIDNPKVRDWLVKNPPPAKWQGSDMEYAFTEMSFGPW